MNFTEGHIHVRGCCGRVVYSVDDRTNTICPLVLCEKSSFERFLLKLSAFDFNK